MKFFLFNMILINPIIRHKMINNTNNKFNYCQATQK